MERFEAIIFDMDGLLLDTERIAYDKFQQTCELFGLGDLASVFFACVGKNEQDGLKVLQAGLHDSVGHLEFNRQWNDLYREATKERQIPLKAGVLQLLDAIQALKIPAVVATSTKYETAISKLEYSGIEKYFDNVIGGDQVAFGKPSPDSYLAAAASVSANPKNCLGLEDSENGVKAAVAAGLTVVQIPDLLEPSDELRAMGHIILPSLLDVLSYRF